MIEELQQLQPTNGPQVQGKAQCVRASTHVSCATALTTPAGGQRQRRLLLLGWRLQWLLMAAAAGT
jgi:hypothetical protein